MRKLLLAEKSNFPEQLFQKRFSLVRQKPNEISITNFNLDCNILSPVSGVKFLSLHRPMCICYHSINAKPQAHDAFYSLEFFAIPTRGDMVFNCI